VTGKLSLTKGGAIRGRGRKITVPTEVLSRRGKKGWYGYLKESGIVVTAGRRRKGAPRGASLARSWEEGKKAGRVRLKEGARRARVKNGDLPGVETKRKNLCDGVKKHRSSQGTFIV